jgi:hypothetical protein
VNSTGAFAGRRNRKPQGEILTDLWEHDKLWEAVPLTTIRSRVQVRMLVPEAAFWRHYPYLQQTSSTPLPSTLCHASVD